MTYNVFGGTLNLAQSVGITIIVTVWSQLC